MEHDVMIDLQPLKRFMAAEVLLAAAQILADYAKVKGTDRAKECIKQIAAAGAPLDIPRDSATIQVAIAAIINLTEHMEHRGVVEVTRIPKSSTGSA